VTNVDDIRAQALEVAAGWSPPDQPESWRLTGALFTMIAGHDELLAALSALPPDRLPALLASAAITFLVRRDRPEPLAGYFPAPGCQQPPFDDGFGAAAAAFVSARLPDIIGICASHRYQMNEVARCTQIALGIAAVHTNGPIGLIDLGTGAGVGLQLDRYRFQIDGAGTGPTSPGLTLTCELRGELQPPRPELPPISSRTGIELEPVDLADPAAREWLRACAPPEASALTRLDSAIEVTRRYPATIVAGDAVEALPGLLASLPPGLPAIVTDAYLAVFLAPAQRARLVAVLSNASRTRPVTWLSLDPLVPLGPSGRDSVQGLVVPDSLIADYQKHGVFAVLGARTFDQAAEAGRLLACAHPSGQWVEWLDEPSATPRRARLVGEGRFGSPGEPVGQVRARDQRPVRRALRQERRDSFGRVSHPAGVVDGPRVDPVRDHRVVGTEQLPQQVPGDDRRHRRGVGGDLPRQRRGQRQHLRGRADRADQAAGQCLIGAEHPAGQAPLEGLADADDPRQEPRRGAVGDDAAGGEHEPGTGGVGHDPDVHRQRHRDAHADGRAVDRRDDRLE
jgi:hypothetical protein